MVPPTTHPPETGPLPFLGISQPQFSSTSPLENPWPFVLPLLPQSLGAELAASSFQRLWGEMRAATQKVLGSVPPETPDPDGYTRCD